MNQIDEIEQNRVTALAVREASDRIDGMMQRLWDMAEGSDEARMLLHSLWGDVATMRRLVLHADSVVGMALVGIEEATRQRDAIADELAQIVRALQMHDHNSRVAVVSKFISETYERVVDDHNDAFWSSLPYDIAAAMGDGWSHMDADRLYSLITLDMREVDAEEHGWTEAQVQVFRERLKRLLDEVGEYEPE